MIRAAAKGQCESFYLRLRDWRLSATIRRSLASRSRVCAQTQPFVFALKNAANYGTVGGFFLESLRVPLASGRIEKIAAVNVNPASES
jgi:hypothetical protein